MTPDIDNLLPLFKAEMAAQLSTMELKLVREIQANDQLNRSRHDELKKLVLPYPAELAAVRAGMADLKDEQDEANKDIRALQLSDRRWAGASMLVSAVVAGIGTVISSLFFGGKQ